MPENANESADNQMRWEHSGENLPRVLDPVTTLGVVQKYVEDERTRTRRAVLWLGSIFLFITLLLVVLFLVVGLHVMSNSREAARIAQRTSSRTAAYGAEVEDISSELRGIGSGQKEIRSVLQERKKEEAHEKAELHTDLKRFSSWVSSSHGRNNREIELLKNKIESLEKTLEERDSSIVDLREEYKDLVSLVGGSRERFAAGAGGAEARNGVLEKEDRESEAGPLVADTDVSKEAGMPDWENLPPAEGESADIAEAGSAPDSVFVSTAKPPDRPRDISVVKFPNGDRYEGEFKDGLFHGWGVYYYANGDRYEGQFRGDMKHGKGTMYYNNGDRYTGQFRDDAREGKGSMVFANGNRYVGFFDDGMIGGKGTMLYRDGAKYSGDFENGVKKGNGTFRYPNGDVYEGHFKDGLRHGKGKYVFSDGAKYIGEFRNGKKHGEGRYIYSSGAEYQGEFSNGKRHGYGVCVYPNGRKLKGLWKDGELVRTIDPSQKR